MSLLMCLRRSNLYYVFTAAMIPVGKYEVQCRTFSRGSRQVSSWNDLNSLYRTLIIDSLGSHMPGPYDLIGRP
jgi:hypothetical protein